MKEYKPRKILKKIMDEMTEIGKQIIKEEKEK